MVMAMRIATTMASQWEHPFATFVFTINAPSIRPFLRHVGSIHLHHGNGIYRTFDLGIDDLNLAESTMSPSAIYRLVCMEQVRDLHGIDPTAASRLLRYNEGATGSKRMTQPQANVEKTETNERDGGTIGCITASKPTRTITVFRSVMGSTTAHTVVGSVSGSMGRLWAPQRFGDGASEERKRTFARRNGAKDGFGGAEPTSFAMDETPVVERCEKRSRKRGGTTVESQLTWTTEWMWVSEMQWISGIACAGGRSSEPNLRRTRRSVHAIEKQKRGA